MEDTLTALEARALAWMDENKAAMFDLLSELIHFDTQNFYADGRERPCAEFIEKLYREAGLDTALYCPDDVPGVTESPLYLAGRGTDHRPCVTGVRWGESRDERVMLMAHIDTVPVCAPETWVDPPFSGTQRDGRIYGLGAGDNKFGIAGAFFAVKALDALGVRLGKSVAITSYCDEEGGGGDGALAACLKYPCESFVNLDGGNYEMWATALGGGGFAIELHRSAFTDDWMHMYDVLDALVQALKPFGARRCAELHRNPMYTGSDMERAAFRLGAFGSVGNAHTDARVGFVIYTDKTKAEIDAELDAIMAALRPVFEKAGVETEGFHPTTRFFGYYEMDTACDAFQIMKRSAEQTAGKPVRVCGSCLTDLSVIAPAGKTLHSFNFGILRDFALPGGAHQANEWVDCEQFLAHTKALILFLLRYCGVANVTEPAKK